MSFPRRLAVNDRIHKNLIRQLAFPDHDRLVRLSPFKQGKTTGYVAEDQRGNATLVWPKPSRPQSAHANVLYLENINSIDEVLASASGGRWLKPKFLVPEEKALEIFESRCGEIVNSWKDQFTFQEEREDSDGNKIPGLRRPQIGALHAVLAHWSITNSAATIVMPTGTGKTETMLSLLVATRIPRLLVVVPNSALRDQIADKFLTLGVLEKSGCLQLDTALPIVASLGHRPSTPQEVDDIFYRANVIVSTMQVVGQCDPEVQARMAQLCSHLFIDEAHHIAAKTWNDFKNKFKEKPILQFTATPFRTDGKRVDGKFIYVYPLAKAQAEGYFKPITFIPVSSFDVEDADVRIARKVREILTRDLDNGFDHIIMARADTIPRAGVIREIYERELYEFSPVLIHSKTSSSEKRRLLEKVKSRESRVVICVDMFGEGFDFPELKIAALHDRHKSLAITLQFIGRFTRTKVSIGDASVVANISDDASENALRNLYAEEADWNFILRMLSEGATDRARKRSEILAGFTSALPEIPLQTLYPRMSAVVYRTTCERWDPTKIEDVIPGAKLYAGPVFNPEKNIAIFVTRDEELVRWGSVKQVQNVEWNLYVVHWNEVLGLLFINSSKRKDFHEHIAEATTGSTDRILGESVFRALGGIKRLTLTNLGLSHAFGKNIRYTMFMGADIADGLTEVATFNKRKSNLFGFGYERDESVTVGCSFKGRLWSHKIAYDLSEWVDWCNQIGQKLLDSRISIEGIFANLIKARRISERPPLVPVMVSWPEDFLEQQENVVDLEIGSTQAAFFDCDIYPKNCNDSGPLEFSVSIGESCAEFEVLLSNEGAQFHQTAGESAFAAVRGKKKLLEEWFNDDPPIFYFSNGDFLVFNELFELPHGDKRIVFNLENIDIWDWSGVDITTESQGEGKNTRSIQRRAIDNLLSGRFGNYDIVFDDDGSGEAADIVAIKQEERKLVVELFHCKYSSSSKPGGRIEDLYAVCGQAQKCVRWREDPRKLLKRLLYRDQKRIEAGRPSRFEKGTKADVQRLIGLAREMSFDYRVHIVQPGLSKENLSPQQADLLGATENFLKETYSMSLHIVGSA